MPDELRWRTGACSRGGGGWAGQGLGAVPIRRMTTEAILTTTMPAIPARALTSASCNLA